MVLRSRDAAGIRQAWMANSIGRGRAALVIGRIYPFCSLARTWITGLFCNGVLHCMTYK